MGVNFLDKLDGLIYDDILDVCKEVKDVLAKEVGDLTAESVLFSHLLDTLPSEFSTGIASEISSENEETVTADVYGVVKCSGRWAHLAHELYRASWRRLHVGAWREVNPAWRELLAITCVFLALSNSTQPAGPTSPKEQTVTGIADMGIILGGASRAKSLLQNLIAAHRQFKPLAPKHVNMLECDEPPMTIKNPIEEWMPLGSAPDLEQFEMNYLKLDRPLVFRGLANGWPATAKWQDWDYFYKVARERIIPVEIGDTYLSEGWQQKLMPFEEFLDTYMIPDLQGDQRGYLAQHPIFDQIEELEADLLMPDYTMLGVDGAVTRMFWMGPRDTISPVHVDPYSNIYVQFKGAKYIRLYPPETDLKPFKKEESMLSNTSSLPPDLTTNLDHGDVYTEVILRKGDALFIPDGWWHFLKTLQPSISVSHWFDYQSKPPKT
eukprot:Platyproteum_vivax@DN1730_c0_g1_i1.p1